MNFSIPILTLLLFAGISVQPNAISTSIDQTNTTERMCKKDVVKINGLQGKYTVEVGQKLKYSADVHGSVGFTATASSSDETNLPLVKNYIKYDDKSRSRMSGGDSATRYFLFDVKKAGTYTIVAQHFYRGDLEKEYTIEITVVD